MVVVDIIIAYFFILREKGKNYKKIEKAIFTIAMCIYISNVFLGIYSVVGNGIENKKNYEIVGEEKVIVAEYEGNFVIMECEIDMEKLYIYKGKYSFLDISGADVQLRRFNNVICTEKTDIENNIQ